METKDIYDAFLKYFFVEEIVSPDLFNRFKHKGDYFFLSRFDIRLLKTMLVIRETLNKPITVNNWKWGGNFSQRGFRDTSTAMVQRKSSKDIPWFSAHVVAMGLDFDVEGMTANEVRDWLEESQSILPYKIRLENKLNGEYISWVHLDVCDDPNNPKVYLFNV